MERVVNFAGKEQPISALRLPRSGRTALMGAVFGGHTASVMLLVTNESHYTRFWTEAFFYSPTV